MPLRNIEDIVRTHKMAASLNANKNKLSKVDAETIAQGEQISGDIDKRLRSSSGKIYHAEISVLPDSQSKGNLHMDSIKEIIQQGGIDHAECSQPSSDEENSSPTTNRKTTSSKCCDSASQIIRLIQNLQKSVDSMDAKVTASSNFQVKAEQHLLNLEKKQQQDKKEVSALTDIVQQYQVKVDILSDIVIKQNQEISNLKAQMLDAQTRSMRNNITITGIPEVANENCLHAVNQFFVDKLKITDKLIAVDQAYRFG